jgi:hypothetical protein
LTPAPARRIIAALPLARGFESLQIIAKNFNMICVLPAHKAVRRGCDWNEVVLRDGEA